MIRISTSFEGLEDADGVRTTDRTCSTGTWRAGFSSLDDVVGGGLEAGEVTLRGSAQAVDRTNFALQVTRHVSVDCDPRSIAATNAASRTSSSAGWQWS